MKIIRYLFILFIFSACYDMPREYVLPKWDVDLNIPIAKRNYDLDELLSDSEFLLIDTTKDGIIYVLRSDTLREMRSMRDFLKGQLNKKWSDLRFPLTTGQASLELELSETIAIDSANLSDGQFLVEIRNKSNKSFNFELILPGIYNPQKEPLKVKGTLNSFGILRDTSNLYQYTYSSKDIAGKKIEIIAKVDGQLFGDTVEVDIEFKNTEFGYIRGILPPQKLENISEFVQTNIDSKFDSLRNHFTLADPEFVFRTTYYSPVAPPFPVAINQLNIIGEHAKQKIYLADKSGNTNLGNFLIKGGKFEKIYNNDNSNISQILSLLPSKMSIAGEIEINPHEERGVATINDSLEVLGYMSAKTSFNLDSVYYSDIFDINIEDNLRNEIRNVKQAELFFDIENHLPVESRLQISALDDNKKILFTKTTQIDAASIIDAYSTRANKFLRTFTLDSLEVVSLSNCYFFQYRVFGHSKEDKTYYFKPSDKLNITSYSKIRYHVND